MKLVESYNAIYRINDAIYEQLLEAVVDGRGYDLSTTGKQLGIISVNLSDLTAKEAATLLDVIRDKRTST